jgi:hypothetical protein
VSSVPKQMGNAAAHAGCNGAKGIAPLSAETFFLWEPASAELLDPPVYAAGVGRTLGEGEAGFDVLAEWTPDERRWERNYPSRGQIHSEPALSVVAMHCDARFREMP